MIIMSYHAIAERPAQEKAFHPLFVPPATDHYASRLRERSASAFPAHGTLAHGDTACARLRLLQLRRWKVGEIVLMAAGLVGEFEPAVGALPAGAFRRQVRH